MNDFEAEHATYHPSGKVKWLRFLPGLVATAATAVAAAWGLSWFLQKGFYLIFIAPLIAALVVAGVWRPVLTWSHCRNKKVATTASIALGLLLYLGYYHICFLQMIGYENVGRVDLLPRYVQIRMQTDVARDARRPNAMNGPRQGPDRFQQAFNWFFFAGELACAAGLLVAVGRAAASRAYCEACGRWMKSETLKLSPGTGARLWDTLQQGDYSGIRQHLVAASQEGAIACNLTVDHCPTCPAEGRIQSVYLTVSDIPIPGTRDRVSDKVGGMFKPGTSGSLRTLVDHVALNPEEVGALAATFPGLRSNIEAHPDLFVEEQAVAREIESIPETQAGEWKGAFAKVEAVQPGEAGMILTRTNAFLQAVAVLGTFFCIFGIAFVPGLLFGFDGKLSGVGIVWLFAWLILGLFWSLFFSNYPSSRFMLARTRNAFEWRANPAIDLKNQDLFFVDIIPRINWGKMMMENATDIGLLELARGRRELVFEGDRERYWIPVDSIIEIKVESWAEPGQHQLQSSLRHVVTVRAMTAEGPWETWFYRRHNTFRIQTGKRRLAEVMELEGKIREMMKSTG